MVATDKPRRPIKIAAAATLLLVGGYGAFNESQFVSSSDGVISAYVLNVRTPIDGTVSEMPATAGGMVKADQLLAKVDNPLNDPMHLDNLRTLESVAQTNADALAAEHNALRHQSDELLGRTGSFITAVSTRLDQQTAGAARTLAALQMSLNQANIEYERGRQLHADGIMSNADYDKLLSNCQVLTEEVAAQKAVLLSAQSQREAAAKGILTEPGTNSDVAYSRQRADEIAEKLAENTRMLISSRAQAEQAHVSLETEESRAKGMSANVLRAPINGMLWKLDAVNGEHLSAGDTVLSLIDCSQQFLLVEISQDRLNDIALGHTAFIRLSGETVERTGTVVSATGDPQRTIDHKLAAFPVQDASKELATVVIRLDPFGDDRKANPCAVGQTARVRIPTLPTNLASRWVRRIF